MAFYCEECNSEVTIDEMQESERRYSGHVFCRRCQEMLKNMKRKGKNEDWI
jgi:transcription initiation factor IIE alpha subunit